MTNLKILTCSVCNEEKKDCHIVDPYTICKDCFSKWSHFLDKGSRIQRLNEARKNYNNTAKFGNDNDEGEKAWKEYSELWNKYFEEFLISIKNNREKVQFT